MPRLMEVYLAATVRWSVMMGAALGVLFAGAATASAQDPEPPVAVTGTVVDAETGTAIEGAIVGIPARSVAVLTRPDGSFQLPAVSPGTYVLRVRQFGYEELMVTTSVSEESLALRLAPDPVQLEALDVTVEGSLALTGAVVNGATGQPMPGVYVWIASDERGALTDESGRFTLPELPLGPHLIQVEHAGYGLQYVPVVLLSPWEPLQIEMQPDGDVLAGLPEVSDRLRSRRNAARSIVKTFDVERLSRTGVDDVRMVVQAYTFAMVVPCQGTATAGGTPMGHWCVSVGGRTIPPMVCLDGRRSLGGLDHLQRYRPHELYLLEVFGTRGLTIRAYTHAYMETLARTSQRLMAEGPDARQGGIQGLGWSVRGVDGSGAAGLAEQQVEGGVIGNWDGAAC